MSEHVPLRRNAYVYFTDELGSIIGSKPSGGFTGPEWDKTLQPLRKPPRPLHIDTPEKQAKWDAYWDQTIGWWEGERAQERRSRW